MCPRPLLATLFLLVTVPLSFSASPHNKLFTQTLPQSSGCSVPTATDYFLSTDDQLILWYDIANLAVGDVVSIQWKSPSGQIDGVKQYAPISTGTNWCYNFQAPLKANPPSAVSGKWNFKVTVNGTVLLTAATMVVGPNQMAIQRGGVVNAATETAGLIAPGSLVTIRGSHFATSQVKASSTPLRMQLNNISVTFNGIKAGILQVSPSRIDVQAPWSLNSDTAFVQVIGKGVSSNTERVLLGRAAPGVFLDGTLNSGQALVYRYPHGSSTGSFVTPSNPLRRGDQAVFYITGAGPVTDPPRDGTPGKRDSRAVLPVKVSLDGVQANVRGTVLATDSNPLSVGVFHVFADVPNEVATGKTVPVRITVSGSAISGGTVPVSGTAPATHPIGLTSALHVLASGPVDRGTTFEPGASIWINATGLHTNVPAVVRFTNGRDYKVDMPAFEVASDHVVAVTPPFLDSKTHVLTGGDVGCELVQTISGNQVVSNAVPVHINPLVQAPGQVGQLSAALLAAISRSARTIDAGLTYRQQITQGKRYTAVSSHARTEAITTALRGVFAGFRQIRDGESDSVDLGSHNGQSVTIDKSSVILSDAILSALLTQEDLELEDQSSSSSYSHLTGGPIRPQGLFSDTGRKLLKCYWHEIFNPDLNCPSPYQIASDVAKAGVVSFKEAVQDTGKDLLKFTLTVGQFVAVAEPEVPLLDRVVTFGAATLAKARLGELESDYNASPVSSSNDDRAQVFQQSENSLADYSANAAPYLPNTNSTDQDTGKYGQYTAAAQELNERAGDYVSEDGPTVDSDAHGNHTLDTTIDSDPAIVVTGQIREAGKGPVDNADVQSGTGDDSMPPIATAPTEEDGTYEMLTPEHSIGNNGQANAIPLEITFSGASGGTEVVSAGVVDFTQGSQNLGVEDITSDADNDGDNDGDGEDAIPQPVASPQNSETVTPEEIPSPQVLSRRPQSGEPDHPIN